VTFATQSHSTHTTDPKGPLLGDDAEACDICHAVTPIQDACTDCHSPGGAFDGVDDSVIGAWTNWADGIYEADGTTLESGKDKWCAGCHDNEPALSGITGAAVVVDNTDAGFVCTWTLVSGQGYNDSIHYRAAGTGSCTATWTPTIDVAGSYYVYAWWHAASNRATNAKYTVYYDGGVSGPIEVNQKVNGSQWNLLGSFPFAAGTSGSVVLSDDANNYVIADAILFSTTPATTHAPNVIGDNTSYGFYVTGHDINCLLCHDASKNHIDHEHRTYVGGVTDYGDSYRLLDVGGQPAMNIPRPLYSGGDPLDYWEDFALCFECHDRYEVLNQNVSGTNFWNDDLSIRNSHNIHLAFYSNHFDSDWDGIADSTESCIACHNVHGSPTKAMIRHGELISAPGTTNKVPALNFSYLSPATGPWATATWTPNISSAGNYDVYAWWYAAANRATNAKYTVYYNGGSDSFEVNQKVNGSQWNLLGSFPFVAGTSGYVELSNEGADAFVIADAIGWDSNSDANPEIIVDDGTASYVDTWVLVSGQGYGGTIHYHAKPPGIPDPNITVEQSVGGIMDYAGGSIPGNGVCIACHSAVSYERTPKTLPQP
jgi:hypothetical protein